MTLIITLLSKIILIREWKIIKWKIVELSIICIIVERTSNDVKIIVNHIHMVQTQIYQLTKVEQDLLVNASWGKHAYEIKTRSHATTQDPLYPEGHPNSIEQDSQRANAIRT